MAVWKLMTIGLLVLNSGALAAQERNAAWVGSLAITSDYVHRGLSQSSERPALQVGGGVRTARGLYAHLWASTVDTDRQAPDYGGNGYAADLVIGAIKRLGDDWALEISLGQYETFETEQILDYDYAELSASVIFRHRLTVMFAYSPKATDHTRTNAKLDGPRRIGEVTYVQPLSSKFAVTTGVGYADLESVSDVSYRYGSVGLNMYLGRYVASLAFMTTDDDARQRFIDGRADDRMVLTFIAAFGG